MKRFLALLLCLLTAGTALGAGPYIWFGSYSLNLPATGTIISNGGSSGTIYGTTASGGALTLGSTQHATKGKINFGSTSAFDEANLLFGIGTSSPGYIGDFRSNTTAATAHVGGNAEDTGAYISTTSADDGSAYLGAGVSLDSNAAAWRAKAAKPILFGAFNGDIRFYLDSGKTPGNTYTPTEKFTLIGSDGTTGINSTVPGAQLDVRPSSASIKGMLIKGASAQSANSLEIQNNSSTVLTSFNNFGNMLIDGIDDAIHATIQGHSTQTSDIFVVEKSDGTDLLHVTNSGVKFETSGGTASNLDYYEVKTYASASFLFNGTGGASGDTKDVTVAKIGKIVTIYLPSAVSGTSRTSSTELKASALLDSRFRPASDQQVPAFTKEGSSTFTGYLRIETDGSITISKTLAGAAWSNTTANCGLNSGMSYTYIIP